MTTSFAPTVNQGSASPTIQEVSLPAAEPERPQRQLVTEVNNPNPEVQLAQASPGGIPNIPRPGEQPSAVPNQGQPNSTTDIPDIPRPDSPTVPESPAGSTPQQFQFTLAQIQMLDRARTILGNGNYGQPLESVRLRLVTRTNYTQAEINGLGNSLHAMVSGILLAANLHADGIDQYSAPGAPPFTVDQLHAGGVGKIRQALREAGIPTEPMYVGIRRPQDSAAASTTAAAPISSTGNPNPTAPVPAATDPNRAPQAVTVPAAATTTPADERPQATPALQLLPTNNGVIEEETANSGAAENQPVAPAIPRPDAVFAEYRRRQLLGSGEVA